MGARVKYQRKKSQQPLYCAEELAAPIQSKIIICSKFCLSNKKRHSKAAPIISAPLESSADNIISRRDYYTLKTAYLQHY